MISVNLLVTLCLSFYFQITLELTTTRLDVGVSVRMDTSFMFLLGWSLAWMSLNLVSGKSKSV